MSDDRIPHTVEEGCGAVLDKDYILNLVSFKNTRTSAYSCLTETSAVHDWQLDLLQDFINRKRASGSPQPEETSYASEFI